MFTVCIYVYTQCCNAQTDNVRLQIISGSTIIHTESGMLKQVFDEHYFRLLDLVKIKMLEQVKRDIKEWTKENTYADKVTLSTKSDLSVLLENGRTFLLVNLPSNYLDFSVTTKDVIIGNPSINDPVVGVSFDISGKFEISQDPDIGTDKILNSEWSVHYRRYRGRNLQLFSLTKTDLELWVKFEMPRSFSTILLMLNEIKNPLNNYINTRIKNHPDLVKELAIDESRHLKVVADEYDQVLVFQHDYSPTGLTKRNSNTHYGSGYDGAKTVPATPTTTTIPTDTSPNIPTNTTPKVSTTTTIPTDNSPNIPANTTPKVPTTTTIPTNNSPKIPTTTSPKHGKVIKNNIPN